jgi:hypothetical protein
LSFSLWAFPNHAQAQAQTPPGSEQSSAQHLSAEQLPGSIGGTVVDPRGDAIAGAHVALTRPDQPSRQETLSGEDGQFSFATIPPGAFQLTIMAQGFATHVFSGTLHPGESYTSPPIALALATETTQVVVVLPRVELAQEQIKEQEKQRIFGFIPNFYVTYVPDAVPLTPKQKFQLAWKTTVDPMTFVLTGAIAGVQQAQNDFSGYGQGAQGYGKRFGAVYADAVSGTFIGSAILPSLLKQDPRYFYKGSGSKRSRILYALGSSVVCKGDNGRWQADYSNILGNLAAGGISNLYYPAGNREGVELTFENAAIGIGANSAANLFQEFFVRKLTPKLPNRVTANP